MFGLTRREQYWAAQEKAAGMLVSVACAVIKARAEIQVAEAQSDAIELKALRAEVAEMRQQLAARSLQSTSEITGLSG